MRIKKVAHLACFSVKSFTAKNRQTGAIKQKLLTILLAAVSLSLLAWLIMPASFNTDLSLVGQGRPAVVIIYDFGDGRSQALLKSFNEIRKTYEEQVDFLVADIAAPQGRQFAQAQKTITVGAHFFSTEGKKLLVLNGAPEVDVLKNSLKQAYGI